MTVVKALASTLLSLLLFLCLSIAGVAVTVNATALNSGFVTRQIDKLDVVALFNEEAVPELQETEGLSDHPEVIASLQTAVEHNAPAVKSAVNQAVTDIYDYLLHGGEIDLRSTLRSSVLDPSLATSIINDLDLSIFIHDMLIEDMPLDGVDIAGTSIDLSQYADNVTAAIQPWVKEQLILLVPQLYDYILGESPAPELTIPVGPVLGDIGAALKSALLASPPPALAGLTQAQLSLAFDAAWAQTLPQMPEAIALDLSETQADSPAGTGQSLDDAQHGLVQAREVIVYYQEAFWGLVGLTLILILGIVLINHNVKVNCRILGSTFTTYGVIEAAGILISRSLVHNQLSSIADLPQSLRPWLAQLADSVMQPLLIFAIACAALGVILFVVSFLYNRRPEPSTSP